MRPLPLRTSLTLSYTAMLALLVAGLAFGYHRLLVRQLDEEWTVALEDMTRGLHGYLTFRSGMPVLEYNRADPDAVAFVEQATRYYRVYETGTGRVLMESPGIESLGLRYTPEDMASLIQRTGIHDLQTSRGRLRIHTSLINPAPAEQYLLQVGEPLERLDRTIDAFERQLAWGLLAGLAAAALAGYWMAGRALTPLSRLARATRAIGVANLGQRVPVRGTRDELDEVAQALNQALERVEHAIGEMQQFSTALAHELRTPLAILRGESELALTKPLSPQELRQRLANQLDEFDKLTRLINQILTLARAEAGEIGLARDAVDLAALSASTVDQLDAVAEARGLTLTCRGRLAGVVVSGDPGWLERLLLILLDNAIKFTPSGGRVDVTVAGDQVSISLEVRDTGQGIPADALPHVFDRFYRADPARSHQTDGAGLGLALARWIVERHGGAIRVTSRVGEGSTFRATFPKPLTAL